jgi:hypothetical protein
VSQIVPVGDDWSLVYVGAVSEGGSGAVIRTRNGGDDWTVLLRESAERPVWWISDLLVGSAPQYIFFIDPHGFWQSTNAGEDWDFRNAGLEDVVYRDGADFSKIGLTTLAVDSDTMPWTVYLGTQQGVFQSIDAGRTWERLTGVSWEHSPIQNLTLSRSPDEPEAQDRPPRLFVTTEEGVQVFYPERDR